VDYHYRIFGNFDFAYRDFKSICFCILKIFFFKLNFYIFFCFKLFFCLFNLFCLSLFWYISKRKTLCKIIATTLSNISFTWLQMLSPKITADINIVMMEQQTWHGSCPGFSMMERSLISSLFKKKYKVSWVSLNIPD